MKNIKDISFEIEEYCIDYISKFIIDNKLEHISNTLEFKTALNLGLQVGIIAAYNSCNNMNLYQSPNQLDLFTNK